MTEELKKKLTEIFDAVMPKEGNQTTRQLFLDTYLAGGVDGYQYAVEKACEWMEENAYLYVDDIDQLHESALIGDFRKCMED